MEAKEKLLPRQESIEAKSGCLLASCDFTKEVAPLLGLKEGDRVLDIGSGIGDVAFHLAKVCRHKSMSMFRLNRLGSLTVPIDVLGVDISAAVVKVGSERAASTDVGKGNVSFWYSLCRLET